MRKLILTCSLSPGDIVLLTGAVRDLHLCYPRQFLTDVRTPCPALWENNPWLTPLSPAAPGVEVLDCHYPLIDRANSTPYHCLHGFIEFLNDRLGLQIRPAAFQGDLHLSRQEKSWYSQVHELTHCALPFWIVVAGGKFDCTIKWWEARRYQAVIDHFRGRIQFVQVGHTDDYHPRLEGVIDLRGRTDLRQLVRLVYHAQGVLCPVTCLMHLAAAVEVKPEAHGPRPCVVVAGGREPVQWEAYPQHQFVHTVGALPCCARGGCWRSRTVPLGDGDPRDRRQELCVDVVGNLPRCMDMITADHVVRRIAYYFQGGALKYLNPPQRQAARRAWAKSSNRPFDECLNFYTAPRAIEAFLRQVPPYPGHCHGRGIIICGGGFHYFPGVWVCLNRLRKLGCQLPVQIWHLGPAETDARMQGLTAPLNAEWVDAELVRQRHPARCLGGWELKAYALLHSTFREILLLDADNVPAVNPAFLFDAPEYRQTGAILWPDLRQLKPHKPAWRAFAVAGRNEPEVESGQLLVDKARCWRSLALAWWYNDHSDFFYEWVWGDKETFHMAFRKTGQDYAMPPRRPTLRKFGLRQYDFQGRLLFQHRTADKWNLFRRNRRHRDFLDEDQCLAWLDQIRHLWDRDQRHYCRDSRPRANAHRFAHDHPGGRAPLRLTMVTLHDEEFAPLAAVTTERMRRYARHHGYGFVSYARRLDPSRHAAWNKLLAVRETLLNSRAQWVVWMDADVVIMNFDCRLEPLIVAGRDLIFGSDFNGLNSAVFLARRCEWCLQFLQSAFLLGDVNYQPDRCGPKWEQNTIKHLLHNFDGCRQHVTILPERKMTASWNKYRPGDFIFHLGGVTMPERLQALKDLELKPDGADCPG